MANTDHENWRPLAGVGASTGRWIYARPEQQRQYAEIEKSRHKDEYQLYLYKQIHALRATLSLNGRPAAAGSADRIVKIDGGHFVFQARHGGYVYLKEIVADKGRRYAATNDKTDRSPLHTAERLLNVGTEVWERMDASTDPFVKNACNKYVLRTMGEYYGQKSIGGIDPSKDILANQMIEVFRKNQWRTVDDMEAVRLAKAGHMVIAGAPGHVAIVKPVDPGSSPSWGRKVPYLMQRSINGRDANSVHKLASLGFNKNEPPTYYVVPHE
jgi:hypothetical protein